MCLDSTDAVKAAEDPLLKTMQFIIIPFSSFGLFANALLILVIVKARDLQSRCNILVAALSAADFLMCIYFLHARILFFGHHENSTTRWCFHVIFYALYAYSLQSCIYFAIGVDRLLTILVPKRYQSWDDRYYIVIVLLLCLVVAFLVPVIGLLKTTPKDTLRECMLSQAIQSNATSHRFWLGYCTIFIVLVTFTYLAAQFAIRLSRGRGAPAQSSTIFLLNPVSIIYFLYIFPLIAIVGAGIMIETHSNLMTCKTKLMLDVMLTFTNAANCGGNFLVYLACGQQFRQEFLAIFKWKWVKATATPSVSEKDKSWKNMT